MTKKKIETLSLDTPVIRQDEDHFQRYEYAKRIASLINQGQYSNSLVIGIYGKWGEGKSSLLNFISAEIDSRSEQIGFNPWYFKDDQQLLRAFFESIATVLGKRLATKKEAVLKAIEDYGESIGSISNLKIPGAEVVGKVIGKLAGSNKDDSLEHYKKRVQDLIRAAKCNFVVFVDDIDRLNHDDIHSVFRLIKLVGDFPRFSYVLAFDDELVAASLGRKFGAGRPKDGYDFLEKIIQVPLVLPKATPFDLRKYALNLINNALDQLNINLNKADTEKFLGKFDGAFVPALKSPRLAVRLANAIAFSIPLLKGEVNISDLMILDGIKVFYPELYSYIRQHPSVFLTHYDSPGIASSAIKENAKKEIDKLLSTYEESLALAIKSMLCNLFPQLNGLFNNIFPSKERTEQWYKEQQICSVYYFDRYFSFAVKKGELSDVHFSQLFVDVDKIDPADLSERLLKELGKLNLDEFIFKLRHRVDAFTMADAANLPLVLARVGVLVPDQTTFQLSLPKEELAKIVKRLITKLFPNHRYDLCRRVLQVAQPLNYKISLYFRFVKTPDDSISESFLTNLEMLQLAEVMVGEFELFNQRIHAFRELPDYDLHSIFVIYDTLNKNEAIMKLAEIAFQNDPRFILKFLKIFTPTIWSTGVTGPQKTFFRVDDYSFMSRFIDPQIYYDRLVKMHNKITIIKGQAKTYGDSLSDDELIAQFQELHELATRPS